jgi:hypothetical protein
MECWNDEQRDTHPILQCPIAPTLQRGAIKKPKKKIALPRRQWQINPSTRANVPGQSPFPRHDEPEFAEAAE